MFLVSFLDFGAVTAAGAVTVGGWCGGFRVDATRKAHSHPIEVAVRYTLSCMPSHMPHHQPSLPADVISTAVTPWLSPAVRSWLPSDNPTAPVTEWLSEEVWRIDNAEFAGQLDAAIPVTVSDPML